MADNGVNVTLQGAEIHKKWIEAYRNEEAETFVKRQVDRLLREVKLAKGSTILDAGCGSGTNSRRLARAGYRVTGVDFSEFALGKAIEDSTNLDIDFRRGDLTNLEFADASFDAVFCFGVLMHIPDLERALFELTRVLKPGGYLMLSETNARSPEMIAFRLYWKRNNKVKVVAVPCGIETWSDTPEGPLLARKMSMPWLIRYLSEKGLDCKWRSSADLTELSIYVPSRIFRKAIYALNNFWIAIHGPASLAVGNLLVFRKA